MANLAVPLCFIALFNIGFNDAFAPGYTYLQSTQSYYKYHTNLVDWYEAKSTCEAEGAQLFHPENEKELGQVWSALGVVEIVDEGSFLHTGIYLTYSGDYNTIDYRPISGVYNKWKPGEPDPGSNHQYSCGRFDYDNRYIVISPCHAGRRFICKHSSNTEDLVNTAVGGVKNAFTDSTNLLISSLEAQRTDITNQTRALQQLATRQTEILERQSLMLEKLIGGFSLRILASPIEVSAHEDHKDLGEESVQDNSVANVTDANVQ